MAASIPILSGVGDLAARFPVWLCDIWGVLHNGEVAFAPAAAALETFRSAGGTVVLITNAPRPHDDVARQIARLGITRAAYDAIVTSGDVTRELIADYAGRNLLHLGADQDRTIYDGLEARLTGETDAVAVVCTGLIDDLAETPETYAPQLRRLHARGLPMICANPDIVVERGAQLCYCAGAIGQAYAALGGVVAYAGKPHAPIYTAAIAKARASRGKPTAMRDVLAIGDGMNTDILGAHRHGVDMLFVASGIHLEAGEGLHAATLARLFAGRPERPVGAIAGLTW